MTGTDTHHYISMVPRFSQCESFTIAYIWNYSTEIFYIYLRVTKHLSMHNYFLGFSKKKGQKCLFCWTLTTSCTVVSWAGWARHTSTSCSSASFPRPTAGSLVKNITGQRINQSINQSINKSINQSVSQSIFLQDTGGTLKPWLNNQTFSFNIVFVTQNIEWLNRQTMFDQTSNNVSPQNVLCVSLLKLWRDMHEIPLVIGCFFPI